MVSDEPGMACIAYVTAFVVNLLIGALIGKHRGRIDSGLLWSFLLGPIGWLIVALMSDLREKCPECGGVVVPGARKCKNCGSIVDRACAPPAPIDERLLAPVAWAPEPAARAVDRDVAAVAPPAPIEEQCPVCGAVVLRGTRICESCETNISDFVDY